MGDLGMIVDDGLGGVDIEDRQVERDRDDDREVAGLRDRAGLWCVRRRR